MRAATGRWSLPVAGSVRIPATLAERTRTWSIRETGKDAGQLRANPRRGASIREVRGASPRSSTVPLRSPSRTTRSTGSAATAAPSSSALSSRNCEANPDGRIRTEGRWATYTAISPSGVVTAARRPRFQPSPMPTGLMSSRRTPVSGYADQRPTVPSTAWYGYRDARAAA